MFAWIRRAFSSPITSAPVTVAIAPVPHPSTKEAEECKNRGNGHMAKSEWDLALASYRQAVSIDPGYAAAHNNIGLVYLHQGRLAPAIACFQQALALEPSLAQAHLNLGNAYKSQGRLEEALVCFNTALALNPRLPEVHNNLGVLFQERGQAADALMSFAKAIALKPDFAEAHNNRGTVLREQGKLEEALACFHSAVTLKPDFALALNNIGTVAQDRGYFDEAYAQYRTALALKPDYADCMSNFLLAAQYDPRYSASALYAEHLRFSERFEKPLQREWPKHAEPLATNRRLRVGFVSGDLRTHPVGFFVENMLGHIDKHELDISLYPTTSLVDDVSQRLRGLGVTWHPLVGLSDDDAAQCIINDGIDILVDLSGHTADNRLLIFARKPAPIQVSWLYFSTTGLRSIDYVLCDRHVMPPAEEVYFVERPWRLPDSYLCFTPPRDEIPVEALPASRNGYATFGCFNNLTKMNDAVVQCWARVLQAVPDSHLFLKSKQLNDPAIQLTALKRFREHGIDSDRLILEGPSPRSQYLACYNRVDIALDPFPFPGGTTTVEALWMGVPVLGRRGTRFISRAGESILKTVGLHEWLADDDGAYAAKAAAFSADREALAALRSSLRARLLASPLCDAQRFASNLEAAFRAMWVDFVTRTTMPAPAGDPNRTTTRC